jgi:hypothetical protein
VATHTLRHLCCPHGFLAVRRRRRRDVRDTPRKAEAFGYRRAHCAPRCWPAVVGDEIRRRSATAAPSSSTTARATSSAGGQFGEVALPARRRSRERLVACCTCRGVGCASGDLARDQTLVSIRATRTPAGRVVEHGVTDARARPFTPRTAFSLRRGEVRTALTRPPRWATG